MQDFEWDDWSHKNFFRIFQALLNLVMAILIVENVYFVQKRAVEKRCQNVHFENLQLWGALARDWLMRLVKKTISQKVQLSGNQQMATVSF